MMVSASWRPAIATGAVFESPYTKRTAPPDAEQVVPGTVYRGDDVIRELVRLIEEFRPTLLVLPHAGDEHPDHCATHRLVHLALAEAIAAGRRSPRVLHYIVHYPKWLSMERDRVPLAPSTARSGDWRWETLPLTSAEQSAKRRALEAFRSQMLVMPEFLRSFEQTREVFIEGEPAQPVPCWCGTDFIASRRQSHSRTRRRESVGRHWFDVTAAMRWDGPRLVSMVRAVSPATSRWDRASDRRAAFARYFQLKIMSGTQTTALR